MVEIVVCEIETFKEYRVNCPVCGYLCHYSMDEGDYCEHYMSGFETGEDEIIFEDGE